MKCKKQILAVILLFTMLFGGCGLTDAISGVTGSDPSALKDVDTEKYVTLGNYVGVSVSVDAMEVDISNIEEVVWSIYISYFTDDYGVYGQAAKEGDAVNIDYIGYLDGEAFDGGSAEGTILTLGSGTFIDGFEEGLIGVSSGETVDLNLTFPESYSNTTLAGQEVVFTVTVNYVIPCDDLVDAVIASIGLDDVTNGDELYDYVYTYYYESALSTYESDVEDAVLDAVLATCIYTGDLPSTLLARYREEMESNLQYIADLYGIEAETLVNYYYSMDLDEFLDTYAEESLKEYIALQAIANAEGLNISDETLETRLAEDAESAGYDSVEDMIGDYDKEIYREYYMYEAVLEFLIANAVVTEN